MQAGPGRITLDWRIFPPHRQERDKGWFTTVSTVYSMEGDGMRFKVPDSILGTWSMQHWNQSVWNQQRSGHVETSVASLHQGRKTVQ